MDAFKSSTCLRKNPVADTSAPSAALAMAPSQHWACISTTSTATKIKMIRHFTMTNRSRSVDVTWSINLGQHSICMSRRSMVVFIPQEQVKSRTQEGIMTGMILKDSSGMAIKDLTRKSRASMIQIVKSAILQQTKPLKRDRKELKSLLYAVDAERRTVAPLLSTFTLRRTTIKFLQRAQSEAQEDYASQKKANRAPTSKNPPKNLWPAPNAEDASRNPSSSARAATNIKSVRIASGQKQTTPVPNILGMSAASHDSIIYLS